MPRRITDLTLHLDNIPAGELPSLRSSAVGSLVLWLIGDTAIWLRRDQLNELASKLLVHIDTDPTPPDTHPTKEAA